MQLQVLVGHKYFEPRGMGGVMCVLWNKLCLFNIRNDFIMPTEAGED